MQPGIIPYELSVLIKTERELLSRIKLHLKIIRFSGFFGQYGFKGQAVLFALDVFEVVELLSRSSDSAGILMVTEHF